MMILLIQLKEKERDQYENDRYLFQQDQDQLVYCYD